MQTSDQPSAQNEINLWKSSREQSTTSERRVFAATISGCPPVSLCRCLIFLHFVDISQSLADLSRRAIILCFFVARILMATMKSLPDTTVFHSFDMSSYSHRHRSTTAPRESYATWLRSAKEKDFEQSMTQPNRNRLQRKLQRLRSTIDKCFLWYAHSAPLAQACLPYPSEFAREMPKTRIAVINADVESGIIYHRLFFSGHNVWKYAKPTEVLASIGKDMQNTANKQAKGAAGADTVMNGNRFLHARAFLFGIRATVIIIKNSEMRVFIS